MPDAAEIATGERTVRRALPAVEEIALPGWVVRISGGTTKRVNSANPAEAGATLGPLRAEVERLYAARDLPARFRLTPLAASAADTELADAGYVVVDRSLTMWAEPIAHPVDPSAHTADGVSNGWMDGLAQASGWSAAQRDAHAAVLARMPPNAIVTTLVDDDAPIAFGIGSIADRTCCLFDIAVTPDRRGQGVGRRLVGSILGLAHQRGVRGALLQVLGDNDPARALYRSLGFSDAFPYHYRVRR